MKGMGKWFLLLALIGGDVAAQQRYSDWSVARQSYGYIASTLNDDGQEFGKICYAETQNCLWAFTDIAMCADGGGDTPALLATNGGAVHVTLHCFESDGAKLYSISPYDSVGTAVKSTGRLAIAIPMVDGLVKVVRFSLSGSNAAISDAEGKTVDMRKSSTRSMNL